MKLNKILKSLSKPKTVTVVLLISVLLYMLFKHRNIEGLTGKKKFILFYMDGCPHCENMMPEWDKFSKNNNTNIISKKIERKEDPEMISNFNVTSYPTILLISNGKKLDTYKGERTATAFMNYCQSH